MTRRKDGVTCTTTARSTGKRCGNPPIPGGTVCRIHGGNVPVIRAAGARRVFEALVAPALVQYRNLIEDPDTPAAVRASVLRDLFDRTGYKPPTQIEVLTDAMIEADIERLEQELPS